jgi:hypothetical protein
MWHVSSCKDRSYLAGYLPLVTSSLQEPLVDPVVGIMDPDDTLELLRDALRKGTEAPENLSATERTNITAHSALETFSYDVHVKLGMEVGLRG